MTSSAHREKRHLIVVSIEAYILIVIDTCIKTYGYKRHKPQQAHNDSCCISQMQSCIIWWHSKRLTAMQTPPGAIITLAQLFLYTSIYIIYFLYILRNQFYFYFCCWQHTTAQQLLLQHAQILSAEPQCSSLTRLAAQCGKRSSSATLLVVE